MSLAELPDVFSDAPSDEQGGQEANRGLSFQAWWATHRAFELLLTGADFLIVMEWKQDVAETDSESIPSRIRYYQIKKNEKADAGHWDLTDLIAMGPPEPKKMARSILGKLYQSRQRIKGFPAEAISLGFISNRPVRYFKDSKWSHCTEDVAELPQDVVDKIVDAIAKDLQIAPAEISTQEFRLTVTQMPIGAENQFVQGLLSQVNEARVLPFEVRNLGLASYVVTAQLLKRAGKRAFARDLDKLKERALSREQVIEILREASGITTPRLSDTATSIIDGLEAARFDYRVIDEMRAEMTTVCVDVSTPNHPSMQRLARLAETARSDLSASSAGSFNDDLSACYRRLSDEPFCRQFRPGYLYLLAALTLRNNHELRAITAATHTQPEDE